MSELIPLKCRVISELICCNANLVRTDSLQHKLIRELTRFTLTLSVNGFSEEQTSKRADSVMHILVSELIHYTTQPRQRTDLVMQIFVNELIHYTTQPHERTDSAEI
jgi:hypothetical protein